MLKDKRILIIYASRYGSTAEIAEKIGNYIAEEGPEVEVLSYMEITDLHQYDAIIVGSPIRYEGWMPAAKAFVLDNLEYLNKIPVAYFFSCLALAIRTEGTERKAAQYAEKLRVLSPQVKPIDIGRFSGVLEFSKMSLPLRIIFRIFGMIIGLKEGDYRDWDEIRRWSKNISSKLDALI